MNKNKEYNSKIVQDILDEAAKDYPHLEKQAIKKQINKEKDEK